MADGSHPGGPPQTWPASYYDGRSSARHPVTVTLSGSGLTIQREDGTPLSWRYDDVRQTQGEHAGEPIRLECGAPLQEALVIDDASFAPALRSFVEHRYRHFRFPLSVRRRIAQIGAAFMASIAAVAALVLWGIPALADLVTPWVPVSWEVSVGQAALGQMVPDNQRCTNERLRKRLDLLMVRLVDPSKTPYEFHLTVVDSQLFNAYALPGGNIVIFRPLLQATKTPEELAGVLAHEAQHVLLRHTTKSLLRDLSLAAMIGAAFGDVSGIGALAVQAAGTLSVLHYSRDMEEQADREGMRLLQKAHFNPAGMIRFFETLKGRHGHIDVPGYLSTHPQTEERIARLKAMLHHPSDTSAVEPDEEWQHTAALCRA
ncbi:M48 family metallopeptidase [Nitrospira moscoviensis]|uniref:Putative Peptidase, family M48 n=1 Tax=Nitrospira moscoviensis TaxID=42253 RepID=A0A0K2GHG3_NITMO|nr:M48 family metallopeptidase [Nitrospira moscoviensis]ALA60395.1 putative Peptidase, family M48 [Nitrospira moscoviensis]